MYPTQLSELPKNPHRALFYRQRSSHRGIREFQTLQKLKAQVVNQDFLDEICELRNLEFLEIQNVSAESFLPLRKLGKLSVLRIIDANKAKDFSCLSDLSNLKALYLCNLKHLNSIEFLSEIHSGVA